MIIRKTTVLGASTLAGREVIERLRDRAVAVGQVVSCDPGGDANVLSRVGEELVVSTTDVASALEDADLVLACAELGAADAARAREAAGEGAVVLDLTGTLGGAVIDPFGEQTLASLTGAVHALPAAGSILTARLAAAARRAGAAGPLVATCCEPASEMGRPALDELYEQALAVLKFTTPPSDVLGRAWVHDVVSPGRDGERVEARRRREVAALAGEPGASIVVLRPGLFHGVAVAARAAVGAGAWREALRADGLFELVEAEDPAASPAAAARSERCVISRVDDDAAGGAWAFASADSLAFGAVGGAVALIGRARGGA